MPRWFGGQQEEAPCLRELAQALRLGRKLALEYRSAEGRDGRPRVVGPLGLVNKAGTWYLVATPEPGDIRVFRAGRVLSARVLPEAFGRPADFELAGFWARWSAEFEASRPRLQVRLRASPQALAWIPEVFGPAAGPALEAAAPPGEDGWRVVTLSFEHERAAVGRLAGFGDQVGVLDPLSVRLGNRPSPTRSSDVTMLRSSAHRNRAPGRTPGIRPAEAVPGRYAGGPPGRMGRRKEVTLARSDRTSRRQVTWAIPDWCG